jgi:hypothetical protein
LGGHCHRLVFLPRVGPGRAITHDFCADLAL